MIIRKYLSTKINIESNPWPVTSIVPHHGLYFSDHFWTLLRKKMWIYHKSLCVWYPSITITTWTHEWEIDKRENTIINWFLPIFSVRESSAKSAFLLLLAQLFEMLLKLDCHLWAQKTAAPPLPGSSRMSIGSELF